MDTKIYYVYALVDPRNNEIFYIGKGKGRRAWDHLREKTVESSCNSYKFNKIQKIRKEVNEEPRVVFLHCEEYEEDAYILERREIELALSNGLKLTNMQPGGAGGTGNVLWKNSDHNPSQLMKGKTYEEIYGEHKGKELRASRVRTSRGRIFSEETRRKMSESAKLRCLDESFLKKCRKPVRTEYGVFESVDSAACYEGVTSGTIIGKLKSNSEYHRHYQYIPKNEKYIPTIFDEPIPKPPKVRLKSKVTYHTPFGDFEYISDIIKGGWIYAPMAYQIFEDLDVMPLTSSDSTTGPAPKNKAKYKRDINKTWREQGFGISYTPGYEPLGFQFEFDFTSDRAGSVKAAGYR